MPIAGFSGYNDTTELLTEGLRPEDNVVEPVLYFWDSTWKWGEHWEGFTVQFDLYVFPVVLCCLALMVLWTRPRVTANGVGGVADGGTRALMLFFLCSFGIYLFLQTRIALPVYEFVPGARYIQFPWRLQAFTTVASVMLMVSLVAYLWSERSQLAKFSALFLVLASLFVSLNSNPAVSGLHYGTITDMRVHGTGETDYLASGEFGPRPPPGTEMPRYAHLAGLFALPPGGDCGTERGASEPFVEARVLHFNATWDRAGRAHIPIFLAPGMSALIDGVKTARLYRTCTDPRILIHLPAGTHRISIQMPSWTSLLLSKLRSESMRTRDYC